MANEIFAAGAIGLVIFFIIFWIAVVGFAIFLSVFWILMIIDVAQRNFKNENDKLAWILIVILTGIIGAVIYYFIIKKKNKK